MRKDSYPPIFSHKVENLWKTFSMFFICTFSCVYLFCARLNYSEEEGKVGIRLFLVLLWEMGQAKSLFPQVIDVKPLQKTLHAMFFFQSEVDACIS